MQYSFCVSHTMQMDKKWEHSFIDYVVDSLSSNCFNSARGSEHHVTTGCFYMEALPKVNRHHLYLTLFW